MASEENIKLDIPEVERQLQELQDIANEYISASGYDPSTSDGSFQSINGQTAQSRSASVTEVSNVDKEAYNAMCAWKMTVENFRNALENDLMNFISADNAG